MESSGNAMKDFSLHFRPEGPILSAQANGLGMAGDKGLALKGPFYHVDDARR
jgi:hypothetical protein